MEKIEKINKDFIESAVKKIQEKYNKLVELFDNQETPAPVPLTKTVKEFSDIKKSKKGKYPDFKNEYPILKDIKYAIYIFSTEKFPSYSMEKFEKIKKEKKKTIKLCRTNRKYIKEGESCCLYVGSSLDINQRLKEHLTICNATAYAMHLSEWYPENSKIQIDIWDFTEFFENDKDLEKLNDNEEKLQMIEDLLWEHYQPVFGRQGKK